MSEIKQDFLIKTPEGLYCPYGKFYLDPLLPVAQAVVSHAHGDHARPNNVNVYCTLQTQEIMQLRYKKQAGNFFSKAFQEQFDLGGVRISFLPAGHILGSAMVRMEHLGVVYLYTGDFKLQNDETCQAAEFCPADVLITETTFANPDVSHPPAEEEIKKLGAIQSNILLGVYGLGKAQRITQLINAYCPEKTIWLHHSIFPIHELYRRNGISLGNYQLYHRKSLKQNPLNQVYLIPPLTFGSYSRAKGAAKVFASGWKYLQRGNDADLYISDHADWNEVLRAIQMADPREIWTLHGDGSYLKSYLKDVIAVKIF